VIALRESLYAWGSADFPATLKREIEALAAGSLPLDGCVTPSSYLDDSRISVSVMQSSETQDAIATRIGVFFTEIVASCGCGGEPTEENGYCLLKVHIDKSTAAATFDPLTGY